MNFSDVFKRPLSKAELNLLGKRELVELLTIFQTRENLLLQLILNVAGLAGHLAEFSIAASTRLSRMLDLIFGGSLKSKNRKKKPPKKAAKKKPESGKKLPSERYPNLPIVEVEIRSEHPPICDCGHHMCESKMRTTTERLEVQPKVYYISRENQVIYTCESCKNGIATAPAKPHIVPGSPYGDSFVLDVTLSKLCDLIPINRWVSIAARQGVEGIPPNSLHDFFRHLAISLDPSYKRHVAEIKNFPGAMLADETRHNMMEGSEKKSWYLWSFNTERGVVFQVEDTRAGDVASNFLKTCMCHTLVTDAYRGYAKALAIVNESRKDRNLPLMKKAYCNAHARNNFMASAIKDTRVAKNIIWIYRIIFVLYRSYVDLQGQEFEQVHAKLSRAFLLIKRIAEKEKANLSTKSALYQALDYYLTYYDGLTLFLTDRTIPMSNNRSERTLRNPVIGRKVWYGTHAVESARDQAKVLSLIESCKMLGVNPRKFTQDAVDRLHAGKVALSPYEYWRAQSNNSS